MLPPDSAHPSAAETYALGPAAHDQPPSSGQPTNINAAEWKKLLAGLLIVGVVIACVVIMLVNHTGGEGGAGASRPPAATYR
jgi:hypothetical protein